MATLAATGLAIGGIAGLLSPLVHATRALNKIEHRELVEELAPGGPDLVGDLIRAVNTAGRASHLLISHLEHVANHDELTGLENRRGFFEHAAVALAGHRFSAVALIDLDHFKAINDRLGHGGGDEVLKAFGRVLRQNVRDTDLIGRWGGEEFIMLFPSTNEGTARMLIGRIAGALALSAEAAVDGQTVTFSAGITSFIGGAPGLESAIVRADRALYAAKAGGRDTIVVADPA